MDTSAFQLSRIYGQGWNAAKKLLAAQDGGLGPKPAATPNPYATAEARDRWSKGFTDGLRSRTGARVVSNHNSWRPRGRR